MSEDKEEGFDMSILDPNYEPEPETAPEPEPEPEVDSGTEVDEQVDEQTELPADDEPQSDPKQDLIDKEVQRLQQLRATYEREIDKLQKNPSEKQVERVEKAKSKLEKFLGEADVDPYSAPREIAEEVLADRGRVEQLLQQFEAQQRAAAEREARQQAEMARLRFEVDHPELKGRYIEFANKVSESMLEEYGEDLRDMPENVYVKLANREFNRLIKEAAPKEEKPKEDKPPADSAKKPKATRPVKTKSGGTVQSPQDSEAKGEALISQIHQQFFGG